MNSKKIQMQVIQRYITELVKLWKPFLF